MSELEVSRPHQSPFSDACRILRAAGFPVQPSDIVGLTFVNGIELTMGQVIDLARKLPPNAPRTTTPDRFPFVNK